MFCFFRYFLYFSLSFYALCFLFFTFSVSQNTFSLFYCCALFVRQNRITSLYFWLKENPCITILHGSGARFSYPLCLPRVHTSVAPMATVDAMTLLLTRNAEIAETDEGRERAKAAEARIKEFRAGGREVESEEPAAKRARGSDESMEAEVADNSPRAAQEPMEDDAEDRMEKQNRAPGSEDLAERTKKPREDDDVEDMLLEVACQDDFDEAGWPRSTWTGEVAEEFNDDRSGKKLDPKKVRQARDEELVELERRVYVEADVEERVKVTGKKPIHVRSVDVDKGFGVYRSRLVAKDSRPKNQDRRPRGTLRRRWRS